MNGLVLAIVVALEPGQTCKLERPLIVQQKNGVAETLSKGAVVTLRDRSADRWIVRGDASEGVVSDAELRAACPLPEAAQAQRKKAGGIRLVVLDLRGNVDRHLLASLTAQV